MRMASTAAEWPGSTGDFVGKILFERALRGEVVPEACRESGEFDLLGRVEGVVRAEKAMGDGVARGGCFACFGPGRLDSELGVSGLIESCCCR